MASRPPFTAYLQRVMAKTLICNNPGNIEYIERIFPVLKDDEVLLKIKSGWYLRHRYPCVCWPPALFCLSARAGSRNLRRGGNVSKSCSTAKVVGQRYSVIPCIPLRRLRSLPGRKPTAVRTSAVWRLTRRRLFSEYLAVREQNLVELSDNSPTARARWLSVSPSAPTQHAALTRSRSKTLGSRRRADCWPPPR